MNTENRIGGCRTWYSEFNENRTDTYEFLMENQKDDLERFASMGKFYVVNGSRGTFSVNVSNHRKYVIDRDGNVLIVKDKYGCDVLHMPYDAFASFLRELRVFCSSKFLDPRRYRSFNHMEEIAG